MPDANPFAGLVPMTPESLSDRRQLELDLQNKDPELGYWARSAGQSGLNLRNQLIAQGRHLNADDRRALATQTILQNAQTNLAELVKNGSLDPMDAQELVINKAMTEFMSVGDYQAAQSLIPQLNQVRSYRAELNKLRSETFQATSAGQKSLVDAGIATEKLPFEERLLTSQSGAQQAAGIASRANAVESLAKADLANRTDPNKEGAGALSLKIPAAEQVKVRASQTGVLNLFDRLDAMSALVTRDPRASSATGASANTVGQYLSGFANSFASAGSSVGGYGSLSTNSADARNSGGRSPKEIVESGRNTIYSNYSKMGGKATLGIDVTLYESLVIDTAYALARANDPGGRLSDNDFQFALKTLGAVQNPAAAKAAFLAIAERAYGDNKNRKRVYPEDAYNALFGSGDKQIAEHYQEFQRRWGPEASAAPARRTGSGRAPSGDLNSRINEILGQ